MFHKKSDHEETRTDPPVRASEPPMASPATHREAASIGPTIAIRGDVSGEEDLLIHGRIEGTVNLAKNAVTVGKDGHVSATVHARVVTVEGHVDGDLHGDEQVMLRRSARVQGNIVAPRVTLEDGCHFKGSIDMDAASTAARTGGGKIADLKPAADKGGSSRQGD
jgi:cytoskeletal protein CcmA (bactofilin family)